MRMRVLLCLIALSWAPVMVRAQTPGPALPRVHVGQTVWIVTLDGQETTGSVIALGADRVSLRDARGERDYALPTIRRILVRDSRKNGTLIGATVGAAASGTFAGLVARGLTCERDCGADYSAWRDALSFVALVAAVGAGYGATAGFVIDHLIKGRDVVYERVGAASWAVGPMAGRSRFGAALVLSWR